MRNYQLKKNNNNYMPHDLYMRVQYIIRGYERLKKEYSEILYSSYSPSNGQPRGGIIGDPTYTKTVKLEQISMEIKAIEQTITELQEQYSELTCKNFNPIKAYFSYNYFNYIYKRKSLNDYGPSRRTWNYFKSLFSQKVAKKLNFI